MSFQRWKSAARLTIVAGAILHSNLAVGQVLDQDFAGEILAAASELYTFQSLPEDGVFLARDLRPLASPLIVPNLLDASIEFESQLGVIDTVPGPKGSISNSVSPSVLEVVLEALNDVQLANAKLDPSSAARLAAARKLLFISGEEPSPEYKAYRRFEEKYRSLLGQLAAETNSASRVNLQNQLVQVESDWALFGMRNEIEAAKAEVASGTESRDKMLSELLQELKYLHPDQMAALKAALMSDAWSRVSFSPKNIQRPKLSVGGSVAIVELPSVTRLSFDVALVELDRKLLSRPFFVGGFWRLRSGRVMSDGDDRSDNVAEVLPRIATHILLIKNLEIKLVSDLPANALKAMSDSAKIEIGTIPISDPSSGSPAFQQRVISSASPIVLGLVVADLAKIPNPNIGMEWAE